MYSMYTIMYVEDRDEDVALLRYAFLHAAIDNPLWVASDGQQAIDYLAGEGEYSNRSEYPLPYIILLDLKLPRRTGLEVLQWIRQQPSIKSLIVIIFSSSVHERDLRRAYDFGANAFLVKPSDVGALRDMCQALKHFWILHNTPPLECAAQTR